MSINKIPVKAFTAGDLALDTFTATASQTAFTLSVASTNNSVIVTVNDVLQVPPADYSVNGTTLTFTSALELDDEVVVRIVSRPSTFGTVEDGAISSAKLATGAIEAKLGYTPVSPTQLNNLIDSAPTALDTLNELAAALNDDANFASTVTTALAGKQDNLGYTPVNKAGDTMTGNLTVGEGNSTLTVQDTNGYARITHNNGSAQLGLFRSGSGSVGGGYIGADGDNCFDVRDSSFATRLRISQSGAMTIPNQPAFQTNGASYSLATNEIWAIRPSASLNTGGHYSTANGRFTAPIAGRYQFHFMTTVGSAGVAAPSLYFRINGSGVHGRALCYYTQYSSTSCHVIFNLSTNDYVEAIIESWNSVSIAIWETSWGGSLIS